MHRPKRIEFEHVAIILKVVGSGGPTLTAKGCDAFFTITYGYINSFGMKRLDITMVGKVIKPKIESVACYTTKTNDS